MGLFDFLNNYKEKMNLKDFAGLVIKACPLEDIKIIATDDDYIQHLNEQGVKTAYSHADVKDDIAVDPDNPNEANETNETKNGRILKKDDFDDYSRHTKRPYIGPMFEVIIPPNGESIKFYVPCSSVKFEDKNGHIGKDCEVKTRGEVYRKAKHLLKDYKKKLVVANSQDLDKKGLYAKFHSYRPFITVRNLIASFADCVRFNADLAVDKQTNNQKIEPLKTELLEAIEILNMIPIPDSCLHEFQVDPEKIKNEITELENEKNDKNKPITKERKEEINKQLKNLKKLLADPDIREPRKKEIKSGYYTYDKYFENIERLKSLKRVLFPSKESSNYKMEGKEQKVLKELQELCISIFQEQECLLATGKFLEEKNGSMTPEERKDKIHLMFNMTDIDNYNDLDTSDSSKLNGTIFIQAIIEYSLSAPYFKEERRLEQLEEVKDIAPNSYNKQNTKVNNLEKPLIKGNNRVRNDRTKEIINEQKSFDSEIKREVNGHNDHPGSDDPPR